MASRRLAARWSGTNEMYAHLARVLEYSATVNCEGWAIDIAQSRTKPLSRYEGFRQKALDWWRVVRAADDGDELAIVDVDTVINAPLSTLWTRRFDLAVTVRAGRERISSGVLFLRRSPATLAFMERWMRLTARLHHDPKSFRFADQHALVRLLEGSDLEIIELPCHLWNLEQHSWARFDVERTKIIHVTSHLRRPIFIEGHRVIPGSEQVLARWRYWEALANETHF